LPRVNAALNLLSVQEEAQDEPSATLQKLRSRFREEPFIKEGWKHEFARHPLQLALELVMRWIGGPTDEPSLLRMGSMGLSTNMAVLVSMPSSKTRSLAGARNISSSSRCSASKFW
jgi:hypothetical protein